MKKSLITLTTAAIMAVSMSMTAWAAEWKQDTTGWWYEQDGGGYATGWQWIDGKCYYFDTNGYMAANTEIDGYSLNSDGQWIVNGIVQTQGAETETKIDIASYGYTNGVSNIAIEMITANRADLIAKYGAESIVDDDGRGVRTYAYANLPFKMEYGIKTQYADQMDNIQNGTDAKAIGHVTVIGSPSDMVDGLTRANLTEDEMYDYLKQYKFNRLTKAGNISLYKNMENGFVFTYKLWDYPGYEILEFDID